MNENEHKKFKYSKYRFKMNRDITAVLNSERKALVKRCGELCSHSNALQMTDVNMG
jgi:uncharacterized cysteine cluster protein YcgN (CxxCxxCC family)